MILEIIKLFYNFLIKITQLNIRLTSKLKTMIQLLILYLKKIKINNSKLKILKINKKKL